MCRGAINHKLQQGGQKMSKDVKKEVKSRQRDITSEKIKQIKSLAAK